MDNNENPAMKAITRLNTEESRLLIEALKSPGTEPNEVLKKAIRRYRTSVISDVNRRTNG